MLLILKLEKMVLSSINYRPEVGNLFTITGRINRGLSLGGPQITINFILKFYLYLTTRVETV